MNRPTRVSVRALLLLATAALLVGASGVATEPAGAASRLCKNTYGGDVIRAKRMGCKRARRVVRAWGRGYKRDGRIARRARGFKCRGWNSSVEGLVVTCRRGKKRVTFYANVP